MKIIDRRRVVRFWIRFDSRKGDSAPNVAKPKSSQSPSATERKLTPTMRQMVGTQNQV